MSRLICCFFPEQLIFSRNQLVILLGIKKRFWALDIEHELMHRESCCDAVKFNLRIISAMCVMYV